MDAWLSGGFVVEGRTPVADAAPLGAVPGLSFCLECLAELTPSPFVARALGVSLDMSLWSGDWDMGEFDFLL
jgi:hypothetical protein